MWEIEVFDAPSILLRSLRRLEKYLLRGNYNSEARIIEKGTAHFIHRRAKYNFNKSETIFFVY